MPVLAGCLVILLASTMNLLSCWTQCYNHFRSQIHPSFGVPLTGSPGFITKQSFVYSFLVVIRPQNEKCLRQIRFQLKIKTEEMRLVEVTLEDGMKNEEVCNTSFGLRD